jgi:predicted ATPase
MKLVRFRLRNYRSFIEEQEISFTNTNILIGPNNVGKSNFLRAIELFFSSIQTDHNLPTYQHTRDFPRTLDTGRTSLTAVFHLDDSIEEELELIERYARLRRQMKVTTGKKTEVQINLQFSEKGTPFYSLFPGLSIPHHLRFTDDFSTRHLDFVEAILSRFYVVYIPAEKELKSLYNNLIVEVVKQEIAEQIGDILQDIRRQADLVSDEINKTLQKIGMPHINVFFEPPQSFEELISGFDMTVADQNIGNLFEKSMGMQWLIIASCISWISLSLRRRTGLRYLWLIEEPESYLHPELFSKQRSTFERIGENADIVYTTHSLGFISTDISRVNGVFQENSQSSIIKFDSYDQAIGKIKKGIGARFSDYFNLNDNVVAVEGKSDVEYLKWFLGLATVEVSDAKIRWSTLLRSDIIEFGGTVALSGFIRANYQFIREEIAFVPMFDGDEAAKRATRDLRNYLNGKKQISFNTNAEYVILPNGLPIEGLFPNYYLKQYIEQFPSWFKDREIDTEQKVLSFSLADDKKSNFAKTAMLRAGKESFRNWSDRWLNVCDALETCLRVQNRRLG